MRVMDRAVVPKTTVRRTYFDLILVQLRLCWPPRFYESRAFLLCAMIAPLAWTIMAWVLSVHSISLVHIWSAGFISVVIWSPFWEELLFRGLVQSELIERGWIRPWLCGLSGANIFASLLFTFFHFWSHSPIWAALVFFPSLVFGYLRDRFNSTVPSILMHMWYNSGYFAFIDSSHLFTQFGIR